MTLDFKETGRRPTRRPLPRRSAVSCRRLAGGQYPGTCSGDSVDRQNAVLQCCALLPACRCTGVQFLHTVKHFRIVSYRITIFCVISYCVPYGCIVPSLTESPLTSCRPTGARDQCWRPRHSRQYCLDYRSGEGGVHCHGVSRMSVHLARFCHFYGGL